MLEGEDLFRARVEDIATETVGVQGIGVSAVNDLVKIVLHRVSLPSPCILHGQKYTRNKASLQQRAYEDSSQNALWRYMLEYFVRRYTELVKEKLGTDLLDTQLAYSIRFYCMGSVGMTQEWVLNDNITSAETVVQMMFNSMPENLRRILF
ncbi:MAG: TetR family transcriptional regulator C-terminal domain-containing protein [Lachnospiraceae bacterium]|nr:TetR family transcriptional regulator C-terminal domain-containing protein [Lachnospiraceae bacterium]